MKIKKQLQRFANACISLIMGFCACSCAPTAPQYPYGGDPVGFQSFSLTVSGTTAQFRVYEGRKTETGVRLESYIVTNMWNEETNTTEEERSLLRAVDGGEEVYDALCAVFGDCGIPNWAGFSGPNPPEVLDGGSMSFTAVLADGTEIHAQGTNNYPPYYSTFRDAIQDIIELERIESVAFTDGTYAVTLPESWVGTVTARHSDFGVSFSVDRTDGTGNTLTFFIIDNTGHGYTSDDYKGRVPVGRLVSDGEERFITVRDHDSISSYADRVSEKARALWESYESDKRAIIDSFRAVNGYTLIPEDGSTLYTADAELLADDARSLWLYLNFAGEYSGGAAPTVIDGREYTSMFSRYKNIRTIEEVRARFLQTFSESFTDQTLNRAIADKDMLEYNDDVYVAYKKYKGEPSLNSWVEDVRTEEDGGATVVMAVRTQDPDDTVYIELPAEKNANGAFVFTDYPYWDESE